MAEAQINIKFGGKSRLGGGMARTSSEGDWGRFEDTSEACFLRVLRRLQIVDKFFITLLT